MSVEVVELGWATSVQDLGRPGHGSIGVPMSGAVDLDAAALANRLVGNPPEAAVIETRGSCAVRAVTAMTVATSADGVLRTMRAGEYVRVDAPPDGLWGYLAVRGGIDVDPVLGSRSSDSLSGLGPPPLTAGAVLRVGPDPRTPMPVDLAPPVHREGRVRIWEGPRADWFVDGLGALLHRSWTVTNDVSRVGVRLSRSDFARATDASSMSSEGLITGAIQITPSGEPIVMLADHPTTGGYPVIAVVEPADLTLIVQSRPGATVRLVRA